MQYNKDNIFKAKEFGKRETVTRKNKCFFMIMATQDNKVDSWSLVIINAIHN